MHNPGCLEQTLFVLEQKSVLRKFGRGDARFEEGVNLSFQGGFIQVGELRDEGGLFVRSERSEVGPVGVELFGGGVFAAVLELGLEVLDVDVLLLPPFEVEELVIEAFGPFL